MESHTAIVSAIGQKSRGNGAFEIVPGSLGEKHILTITSPPTWEDDGEWANILVIFETKRGTEIGEEYDDIFRIRDIISIVESYEPLTVFSNLPIWKRNAISLCEAICILSDVSSFGDTFSFILKETEYAKYAFRNMDPGTDPSLTHPMNDIRFKEAIFFKVLVNGSYDSYRALYHVIFEGGTPIECWDGESWRQAVFTDDLDIRHVFVNLEGKILKYSDVESFSKIFPVDGYISGSLLMNFFRESVRSSLPHLRHFRDIFINFPRVILQNCHLSPGVGKAMKGCALIWDRKSDMSAKVLEIVRTLMGAIQYYLKGDFEPCLSTGLSVQIAEIARVALKKVLSLSCRSGENVASAVFGLLTETFISCAKRDADYLISKIILEMIIEIRNHGGDTIPMEEILLGGFLVEEHIPDTICRINYPELIGDVMDIYGSSMIVKILTRACNLISEARDTKTRESRCYLFLQVGECLETLPRPERCNISGTIREALVVFKEDRKDHVCVGCCILPRILEDIEKLLADPTGSKESTGMEKVEGGKESQDKRS